MFGPSPPKTLLVNVTNTVGVGCSESDKMMERRRGIRHVVNVAAHETLIG